MARVNIGDFFANGYGDSKKEAKNNAAIQLKKELKIEKVWHSQLLSTPIPKGVYSRNFAK